VEFLLDETGEFYFLEMNTRLQVEHPVTELVNGVDLVRAQILVAQGEALPWTQDDVQPRGHAIECRLYAEDPARNFMPSLGPLLLYREPDGPGVRIDSGVAEGGEVSMHYDPMIAKLSVHAETRSAAIERMRDALRRYPVLGIVTNGEYLDAILAHKAFHAGDTFTSFLEEHFQDWTPVKGDLQAALAAVAVHELAAAGTGGNAEPVADNSPWHSLGHFRLNGLG
jgi:acetyl-CoA carboxylase, biotin carboxylase subunit